MRNERYIEYIQIARKIVLDSGLETQEFQTVTFEIVLKHLIENDNPEFDIEAEVEKRLESAKESSRED